MPQIRQRKIDNSAELEIWRDEESLLANSVQIDVGLPSSSSHNPSYVSTAGAAAAPAAEKHFYEIPPIIENEQFAPSKGVDKPEFFMKKFICKDFEPTYPVTVQGQIHEVQYNIQKEDVDFLRQFNMRFDGGERNPRLSEDAFIFMINTWEHLTEKRSMIHLEEAFKGVTRYVTLADTYIKEVYEYWKRRREDLDRPLLRKFWPTPSQQQEGTGRRPRKTNTRRGGSETLVKLQTVISSLEKVQQLKVIRKWMMKREETKLRIVLDEEADFANQRMALAARHLDLLDPLESGEARIPPRTRTLKDVKDLTKAIKNKACDKDEDERRDRDKKKEKSSALLVAGTPVPFSPGPDIPGIASPSVFPNDGDGLGLTLWGPSGGKPEGFGTDGKGGFAFVPCRADLATAPMVGRVRIGRLGRIWIDRVGLDLTRSEVLKWYAPLRDALPRPLPPALLPPAKTQTGVAGGTDERTKGRDKGKKRKRGGDVAEEGEEETAGAGHEREKDENTAGVVKTEGVHSSSWGFPSSSSSSSSSLGGMRFPFPTEKALLSMPDPFADSLDYPHPFNSIQPSTQTGASGERDMGAWIAGSSSPSPHNQTLQGGAAQRERERLAVDRFKGVMVEVPPQGRQPAGPGMRLAPYPDPPAAAAAAAAASGAGGRDRERSTRERQRPDGKGVCLRMLETGETGLMDWADVGGAHRTMTRQGIAKAMRTYDQSMAVVVDSDLVVGGPLSASDGRKSSDGKTVWKYALTTEKEMRSADKYTQSVVKDLRHAFNHFKWSLGAAMPKGSKCPANLPPPYRPPSDDIPMEVIPAPPPMPLGLGMDEQMVDSAAVSEAEKMVMAGSWGNKGG
uniref:Enhancer of polycomb-like protein n=1 Tax=Chromera velia CCMP2878 TaxID=1169474 RepID=A0A0G4FI47_9ALVE|eukprot:Cvel_17123.t1-p1 / transcript=Cvel_17123.t1 / gene=Cvel_17123 / organism=Chromera_velia_CCMP2878 / gene_product=hypothetical protein / transcript_product=hypothetical protein / location=Cvel_scaffold1351:6538-14858(+) / protein_length=846 / sequence_SO=supercontig / SO=protein_coding / is_pseudo=false